MTTHPCVLVGLPSVDRSFLMNAIPTRASGLRGEDLQVLDPAVDQPKLFFKSGSQSSALADGPS